MLFHSCLRFKFFLWKSLHKKLPMGENLAKRKINIDNVRHCVVARMKQRSICLSIITLLVLCGIILLYHLLCIRSFILLLVLGGSFWWKKTKLLVDQDIGALPYGEYEKQEMQLFSNIFLQLGQVFCKKFKWLMKSGLNCQLKIRTQIILMLFQRSLLIWVTTDLMQVEDVDIQIFLWCSWE